MILQEVRDAQMQVMTELRTVIIDNEELIRNTPIVDEVNYDHLLWLVETGMDRNQQNPVDKTGRWIGFIQCALIVRGILDTNTTRDQTRAIFHAAYLATGQDIPPTLNP
jgi:hypothetical protein